MQDLCLATTRTPRQTSRASGVSRGRIRDGWYPAIERAIPSRSAFGQPGHWQSPGLSGGRAFDRCRRSGYNAACVVHSFPRRQTDVCRRRCAVPYKSVEERRRKQAEYRDRNRERLRERHRRYYREHGDRRRESARRYCERHREEKRQRDRQYVAGRRERVRQQIFELLGTRCARCGFDADVRALQLDRIDRSASPGRKSFTSWLRYYEHVVEGGGSGYRILCANCKQIVRHERRAARRAIMARTAEAGCEQREEDQ